MSSLLIKNVKIMDEPDYIDIYISDGIINKIGKSLDYKADRIIDGNYKLTAIPGLFDMHVHFRDPGFTHKEDILTGCEAALAGGITAVACMPNTNPPADNTEVVEYILDKGRDTGVRIFPVGCITQSMDGKNIYDYSKLGVKIISDDGRPVKNAEIMRRALETADKDGILVASHCEDLDIIDGGIINKGAVSETLGVKGMDRASEDYVTAREIALAASVPARVHICHVSTKGSIGIIRAAKARGVKVTCETCPHYFTLTENKLSSLDADYRMNPPLRTEEDRAAVYNAVLDGTIDCIVTDHAPHTKEEKADFYNAPNGVIGLETSLAVMLTVFYHTGKMSLADIVRLMSYNPRKLINAYIPEIITGSETEIALIDTDKEWTVQPGKFRSKSCNSAFKGEKLKGKCIYTITDGIVRYKNKDE